MKHLAMIAMAASLAAAGGALAQEADPLVHYDAYNAALQAGDYDTASREGEAAWRAAEDAWGEGPDTAILAFNIAQMRMTILDRDGAQEPAARALALASQAADYTEAEARLLHGSSVVNADPALARTELEAAVAALDAAGSKNEDTVRGKLDLAALMAATSPAEAVAMAQAGVQDARDIQSVNLRRYLFTLGTVQYQAQQFGPASMTLFESVNSWEQQQPGEMPLELAHSLAWYTMAAEASRLSAAEGGEGGGGRGGPGGRGGFGAFGGGQIPWEFLPARSCEIRWEEEVSITFPTNTSDQANLGAAVLMYDLDEEGQVVNQRVVAAVPGAPYNDLMLTAMDDWKAGNRVRENCRQGQIRTVHYFF